jgi:hypothetical protein
MDRSNSAARPGREFLRFVAEFLEFPEANPASEQPKIDLFPYNSPGAVEFSAQALSLARSERASAGALTLVSLSK